MQAFSTTRPSALSRINLIGRLVSSPEVRESRKGKEYLRYVVATQDPLGPPNEDGSTCCACARPVHGTDACSPGAADHLVPQHLCLR